MAEVTVSTTSPDTKNRHASSAFREREFIVSIAADGDVFTSGIQGIRECWWRGTSSTDLVNAVPNATTGVITFNTNGAGPYTGKILIKTRG